MKILICTGIYPPDIGGPATYSKLLFDELPKKDIDVEILSFGEVRHLPRLVRHYIYYRKVKERGAGVDLIYAQDPVSVGLPVALASKKIKKKFILKIVGDYAWEQQQQGQQPQQSQQQSKALLKFSIFNFQFSKPKEQKFVSLEDFQNRKFDFLTEVRKRIERWVAKKADKIIVPSEYLKKIVMMWGSKFFIQKNSIDENKIIVIYNAFTPINIVEEKYSLRIRFKISETTIFSAGRLVSWKGFETLVDVVKGLLKIKLYIAGDGPDYFKLKEKIKSLKLENRVFLLGKLKQDDLLKQIKASDIFVLNTGYEGFSHQLLEVMSIGTPIITTSVGGNTEVIRNGKEGLLVDYNDKKGLRDSILKLSKDRVMADRLANNAKKRVKFFNNEEMIEKITNILKVFVK